MGPNLTPPLTLLFPYLDLAEGAVYPQSASCTLDERKQPPWAGAARGESRWPKTLTIDRVILVAASKG